MEASDEVYEYISCNLCLVKLEDPGLVYTGEKFEHKDRRWQIGVLEEAATVLVEELKADMDEKPMKAINIVDKKTTKIKAPDVEIKIDVEHSSSIEKREIDGVTYLLVPLSVTSDIEIDGIRLK